MTILFAANELDGFKGANFVDIPIDAVSTRHDADFAVNGAMGIDGNGLLVAEFTPQTDFWVHLVFARESNSSAQNDIFLRMLDSAGQAVGASYSIAELEPDGANGMRFKRSNGSTSAQTIGDIYQIEVNTLYTFDCHVVMHASAGSVEWYVNGNLARSAYNIDTLPNSATQCDRIEMVSGDLQKRISSNYRMSISEFIVATSSTLGMRVATLSPSGAGTTSAWTGAYTTVDDLVGADDTDFLQSNTNAQVTTFAMTNLSATAALMTNVEAVVECFRGHNSVAGIQNIQHAMNSGATDYFSSSVSLIGSGFTGYNNVRETDPDTAAAWTVANVDLVELGVKAIT